MTDDAITCPYAARDAADDAVERGDVKEGSGCTSSPRG